MNSLKFRGDHINKKAQIFFFGLEKAQPVKLASPKPEECFQNV